MPKVNYEVELKLTGFVQLDVPEDLDEEDIEAYFKDELREEEIAEELLNGKYSQETETYIDLLNNSGYLED